MVGSRQPIRVRRGWLVEVRLPRPAGGLNEQIYMISTSNNPVSHQDPDLLKMGFETDRPKLHWLHCPRSNSVPDQLCVSLFCLFGI